MIKLYGFPLSNYFNMVKMTLIEKNIDYELVDIQASQDESFLAMSPMGKVPCIETEVGFLSEANVIIEYLDEIGSGPALFPDDVYKKAQMRELMKEMELYLELPARTCFPEAFFGGSVTDEVKEKAKADLQKGIRCLKQKASFGPYLAGETFSAADVVFHFSVGLAGAAAKRALGLNLLESLPEAKELSALIQQRESAQKVVADQKAG